MSKKVKSIFIILVALNVIVLGIVSYLWIKSDVFVQAHKTSGANIYNVFTASELAKYNGVDPKLPIYLALDGYIYDISKGREFYQVGGPYHDLAGKDSSKELHLVGGGIIKRKYPIVGILDRAK
jgi:predicted heme/steroid binding protein